MALSEEAQDRVLLTVAVAAAGLIHVSIAASQTLLGVGIVLLLIFRQKLQFPRIWIPLAVFFLWTALADVLSPDVWGGRAQIKKFFVFFFIPLIYGVFVRQFSKVFYVMVAWTAAATASGTWALVQFALKYEHDKLAPQGFYAAYLERRVTGFESHWMTFGALQLSVLLLLLAHWFFSSRRMPGWAYGSIGILSMAILLSWTRSIWLAAIPSAIYLVWYWRPKMTLAVPVIAVVIFLVAPAATRQRFRSLIQPERGVDSNLHRVVTFRTGFQMVKAHPWFGIGPEEIRREFNAYVPRDVSRPLPPGDYEHLHNIYLQYAAERGIPGLLFILWFIGMAVWDCIHGIRRAGRVPSQQLFVLHGVIAVTIAILVEGCFEYNLGDSEVLMMYVSVISLGYAALHNLAAEPAPATEILQHDQTLGSAA